MEKNSKSSYEIGEAIRLLRRKKGLTQKKLGEICGMNGRAISRMERGKGYKVMEIPKLIAVANALEMPDTKILESIGMKSIPKEARNDEVHGISGIPNRRKVTILKDLKWTLIGGVATLVIIFSLMFCIEKSFSSVKTMEIPIINTPVPPQELLDLGKLA